MTFTATRHLLGAPQLTFGGADRATGITYLHAWHRFADGRRDGHVYGEYRDIFVRTTDGWRIAERRLLVAGEEGFPARWNPIERKV